MYLTYLLLYLLNYFVSCVPIDNNTVDDRSSVDTFSSRQSQCTGSKSWNCSVSRIRSNNYDAAEQNVSTVSLIGNDTVNATAGRIVETHVFYLNKVDPTSGQLFVSATLRWRFKVSVPQQSTYYFVVSVFESSTPARELARFQVHLHTNNETTLTAKKSQPIIFIRFDNRDTIDDSEGQVLLNFGKTYAFRIAETVPQNKTSSLPLAWPIEKTTTFSSLLDRDDVTGCGVLSADSELHRRRRRELASRWSTSIRQITFYPLHLLLNVSFYGAPASLCIRRYAVELWFHDIVIHERKFVNAHELVEVPISNVTSALVGSVAFDGLERDTKYTIRVVPQERGDDGTCICEFVGKCGCVTIRSNLFTLNNIYNFYEDTVAENTTIPYLVDKDDKYSVAYWLLAAFFLVLTFAFLALILLLFVVRAQPKTREKRNYVFVNVQRPSFKRHEPARKPLIRDAKPTSVLILNAETCHSAEAALLAHLMKSNGMKVFYDRLDAVSVEENVQRWAGQAVAEAGKIILFHGRRAAALIGCGSALARDIFDDAFYATHASLVYTDPRIIHAKWESYARPLFGSAERVFTMPSDWRAIVAAAGVSITDDSMHRRYEELFMELRANAESGMKLPLLSSSPCPVIDDQVCAESLMPILRLEMAAGSQDGADIGNTVEEQLEQQELQQLTQIQQIEPERKERKETKKENQNRLQSQSNSAENEAILAQPLQSSLQSLDKRRGNEDDSGVYSGDSYDGINSTTMGCPSPPLRFVDA